MIRAAILLTLLALTACTKGKPGSAIARANIQEKLDAPRRVVPDGKPLRDAIVAFLGAGAELSKSARFTAAWADLDGDGRDEAIVYLRDEMRCGSGGCLLFVLRGNDDHWAVVDTIGPAQLPIYRLAPGADGWAELGVTVAGGGIDRAVMAVPHAKEGYADNPTVEPARAINPAGAKVLIGE